MRSIVIVLLALALPACAGSPASTATARPSIMTARTAPAPVSTPRMMKKQGVDTVIGARADALVRQFGDARIDLTEGDARKLQFAGDRCILDVFLYPLEAGAAPVATHVEARLRDNGTDTDRGACIADLER